ncbi:hypothetical protein B2I21_36320 [Chryseobacterium mucoviscidosis]|nr:hypothetical protein B2I21_36320 [Chryseobacterium mucoviscidosis]
MARLLDMVLPEDFVPDMEDVLPFKQRLQEELFQPLTVAHMNGFLRELSEKKKRFMCKYLKIPIRIHPKRVFPEAVFFKHISPSLQEQEGKQKLLYAILLTVFDVYEDTDESPEALLSSEENKVKTHGFWHYYWALRLYPERNEQVEKRLGELVANPLVQSHPSLKDSTSMAITDQDKIMADQDNQLIALKRKLERESGFRQQAEQELNRLRKKLQHQEKLASQFSAENEKFKELVAKVKQAEQDKQLALEKKRLHIRNIQEEKSRLLSQTRSLEGELARLREQAAAAERDLKQSKLRLAIERNRPDHPTELAGRLVKALYAESEQLCHGFHNNGREGITQRKEIRELFDLIDLLEQYQRGEDEITIERPKAPAVIHTPKTEVQENITGVNGTFNRRDHGGYIVLENGEAFNITESMVYHHNLEHEAEVKCTPYHENGAKLYRIELLLQGDDAFAPIHQFDGYVGLGEHYTWYCVDINNSENRYPLHEKDVQIRQPVDGDPCLFNVALGGHIARLSRLYRETPDETEEVEKTNHRLKPALPKTKTKPEPFLSRCRIAIVGGQQKWFETVVSETGAELIHENGDHPERIHADLRRANALFLLLTATSHRATWSCIEIAKQQSIPHFVIQGSKSNLRSLLWEHRETILRRQ